MTHDHNAKDLLSALLEKAVFLNASDIHLEPSADRLRVRLRVDGLLQDILELPKEAHPRVLSRLKIMAGLDIAEQRLPHDGKVHICIGGKDVDLRISAIPAIHGEKAVIRILCREMAVQNIEELGMTADCLKAYSSIIKRSGGIIIVTGPTGCGKTTTLYSTLNKLNSAEVNITTIEDPVEYELKGINQVQVNVKAGLTFARGLRSILRQDPDIIMIGEIRDEETARIAVQAALTGHLVLSTMHTNDSAGAVSRLIDLGIEPSLISASLLCVLSQRLLRLTCKKCSGGGCDICGNAGFRGRTGIFELLEITPMIKEMIGRDTSSSEITREAVRGGMKPLKEEGEEKVMLGLTTRPEALRFLLPD